MAQPGQNLAPSIHRKVAKGAELGHSEVSSHFCGMLGWWITHPRYWPRGP